MHEMPIQSNQGEKLTISVSFFGHEPFCDSAFRCCYCQVLNPARRVRRNLAVPRLESFPSPTSRSSLGTPLTSGSRAFSASVNNLPTLRRLTYGGDLRPSSSSENVFEEVGNSSSTRSSVFQKPLAKVVENVDEVTPTESLSEGSSRLSSRSSARRSKRDRLFSEEVKK